MRRRHACPARTPLARRRKRGQGCVVPDARRRQGTAGIRTRRSDRPLPRAASAARAKRRVPGHGTRPPQARAGTAHIDAIRRGERDLPAGIRPLAPRRPRPTTMGTLRIASSFVPNDPDPRSAIAWPNIQLCMQLFDRLVEAWPERTIVPALAERWEIADDGLRYVFHLREGLRWSDGEPLTAHDVEFGIKRVLDPAARARRRRSISCSRTARTTVSAARGRVDASACARSTTGPSSSGSPRRHRTSSAS